VILWLIRQIKIGSEGEEEDELKHLGSGRSMYKERI
jgi:hypothetical protein